MKATKKSVLLGILILGMLLTMLPFSSAAAAEDPLAPVYQNGVALIGQQEKKNSDGSYDYRFVAALKDSPAITGVGFTVEIQYGDRPLRVEQKDITTVYTSMLGGGQIYSASDYGADYLFGVVLRSVPTDYYIGLKVTPYAKTEEQLNGLTTTCILNRSADIAPGTLAMYYDFSQYQASDNTVDVMNMLGWKLLTKTAAAAGLESVTETGTCYNAGNALSLAIKDGKLYCSNSTSGVSTAGSADVFALMKDSDYMALAASQDYVVQYKMTMVSGNRYFGMSINYPYSESGKLTEAGTGWKVTKTFLRPNGKGLSACNSGSSTLMHFDSAFYNNAILSKVYPEGNVKSFLGQEITVTLVSIRADSDTTVQIGSETVGSGLAILVNGVLVSKTTENTNLWDSFGNSTVGDGAHDCYGLALLVSLPATISEIGAWTLNPEAENPFAVPAVKDTFVYENASADLMATIPAA